VLNPSSTAGVIATTFLYGQEQVLQAHLSR
jgi:hypothetical protein